LRRALGEPAVAVVVKEEIALAGIRERIDARGVLDIVLAIEAGGLALLRELHVAGHVQVEASVAVVVAPRRARPESFRPSDA
jgi:hypothetical protein